MNINTIFKCFILFVILAQAIGVASAVEITSAGSYDTISKVQSITFHGNYVHVVENTGVRFNASYSQSR